MLGRGDTGKALSQKGICLNTDPAETHDGRRRACHQSQVEGQNTGHRAQAACFWASVGLGGYELTRVLTPELRESLSDTVVLARTMVRHGYRCRCSVAFF